MNAETVASLYPLARQLHIALVTASVSLFAARGLAVLAHQGWPMRAAWRRLSVLIDVGLLSAGITLWALLQFHPWLDAWLGAKLVLLVVYIVLGSYALKRAPTRGARAAFFLAALACVAFMVSVAQSHHPLGWWA